MSAAIRFLAESCSFLRISEAVRPVRDKGDVLVLTQVSHEILDCAQQRECRDGDCCIILAAALLCDCDRRSH